MLMLDVHLFPNNEDGHALLHQLQQRAEAWAEGVSHTIMGKAKLIILQGIVTMIFSTDNFCKQNSTHIMSIEQLKNCIQGALI
jgi:hypothetical protein